MKLQETIASGIGALPVAFIGAAFFNFFIGAGLGGWMAPIVFLGNILAAVFSGKTRGRQLAPDGGALPFLDSSPQYRATDRIAQRGTDVSLLLLIVATVWMFVKAVTASSPPLQVSEPAGALFLTYYGWIGGTALAVSLHLFPRFLHTNRISPRAAVIGQVLWGMAVLAATVGTVTCSWLLQQTLPME